MSEYRFAWKGSGMGRTWFHASTPQGSGEVEYISDQMFGFAQEYYKRGVAPDTWEREIAPMRNVLIWHTGGATMTQALLRAFNAWRQAEHRAQVAKLLAERERYGIESNADPILQPPPILRGGNWNNEAKRFEVFD